MSVSSKTEYEGVRVRHYQTGDVLQIVFHDGKRRKEQFKLPPTEANKKWAYGEVSRIKGMIAKGTFDYAAEFPKSKEAKIIQKKQDGLLVEAALKSYLADYKLSVGLGNKSQSSYDRTCTAVKRLNAAFGTKPLTEITPAIIRDWIKSRGVVAKTINNDLIPLRAILAQAFTEDEVIDSNPINKLNIKKIKGDFCKKSTHKVDPFTPDEVRKIIYAATRQNKNYIQLGFATGLRGGELIGLRWGDIDWDKKVIHVCHNRVDGIDKVPKTKAGDRKVPMTDEAINALKAQKDWTWIKQDFVFHHPVTNKPFHSERQVMEKVWKPTIKASGVAYREPKQMRHTYASARLSRGDNIHKVANNLGHADATMVLRVYGKWIAEYEEEQLEKKAVNG